MKNSYLRITAWLSTLPALLLPAAAFAQLSAAQEELDDVAGGIGADVDNDLATLVGNLIAVLLSVLGIIFVVLVVYAGFLYLTSQGEAEKVKKAKALLSQAVIGLVIIIAAYAISEFVIDALVTATS
jgi:hypothetical protein